MSKERNSAFTKNVGRKPIQELTPEKAMEILERHKQKREKRRLDTPEKISQKIEALNNKLNTIRVNGASE